MKAKRIRLEGKQFDLQSLAMLFRSPELTIEQEGSTYYLKSNKFDGITNSLALHKYAGEFIEVVNGVARVVWENSEPVHLGAVCVVDESGRESSTVFLAATVSSTIKGRADLTVPGAEPFPFHKWVTIGETNDKVKKALRFFIAKGNPWFNLPKVLETIQSDGFSIGKDGARLMGTANSYAVLGDDARHGVDKSGPPPDPMTLGEAQLITSQLLKDWIDSKR